MQTGSALIDGQSVFFDGRRGLPICLSATVFLDLPISKSADLDGGDIKDWVDLDEYNRISWMQSVEDTDEG